MLTKAIVPEMVTMISCNGVAIKNPETIAPTPKKRIIIAALFFGIFFEKPLKNKAKLKQSMNMPATAHGCDRLSIPFTALGLNKLLK